MPTVNDWLNDQSNNEPNTSSNSGLESWLQDQSGPPPSAPPERERGGGIESWLADQGGAPSSAPSTASEPSFLQSVGNWLGKVASEQPERLQHGGMTIAEQGQAEQGLASVSDWLAKGAEQLGEVRVPVSNALGESSTSLGQIGESLSEGMGTIGGALDITPVLGGAKSVLGEIAPGAMPAIYGGIVATEAALGSADAQQRLAAAQAEAEQNKTPSLLPEGVSKFLKTSQAIYGKETPALLQIGLSFFDPLYILAGETYGIARGARQASELRTMTSVIAKDSPGLADEITRAFNATQRGSEDAASIVRLTRDRILKDSLTAEQLQAELAQRATLYAHEVRTPGREWKWGDEQTPLYIPKSGKDFVEKLKTMNPLDVTRTGLTVESRADGMATRAMSAWDDIMGRADDIAERLRFANMMTTAQGRIALAKAIGPEPLSRSGTELQLLLSKLTPDQVMRTVTTYTGGGIEGYGAVNGAFKAVTSSFFPKPVLDINQRYLNTIRGAISLFAFKGQYAYPAQNAINALQDAFLKGGTSPVKITRAGIDLDVKTRLMNRWGIPGGPKATQSVGGLAEQPMKQSGEKGLAAISQANLPQTTAGIVEKYIKPNLPMRVAQRSESYFSEKSFEAGADRVYSALARPGVVVPNLPSELNAADAAALRNIILANPQNTKILSEIDRLWAPPEGWFEAGGAPPTAPTGPGGAPPTMPSGPLLHQHPPTSDLRSMDSAIADRIEQVAVTTSTPEEFQKAIDAVYAELDQKALSALRAEPPDMRAAMDKVATESGILPAGADKLPLDLETRPFGIPQVFDALSEFGWRPIDADTLARTPTKAKTEIERLLKTVSEKSLGRPSLEKALAAIKAQENGTLARGQKLRELQDVITQLRKQAGGGTRYTGGLRASLAKNVTGGRVVQRPGELTEAELEKAVTFYRGRLGTGIENELRAMKEAGATPEEIEAKRQEYYKNARAQGITAEQPVQPGKAIPAAQQAPTGKFSLHARLELTRGTPEAKAKEKWAELQREMGGYEAGGRPGLANRLTPAEIAKKTEDRILATNDPATPGYTRAMFHQQIDALRSGGLTSEEAEMAKALWDARAQTAVWEGLAKTPDEYFASRLAGVERGTAAQAGELQQAGARAGGGANAVTAPSTRSAKEVGRPVRATRYAPRMTDARVQAKLNEWNRELSNYSSYTAKKGYEVNNALVRWIKEGHTPLPKGESFKDRLIESIKQYPEQANEIQNVAQHLFEKKFGASAETMAYSRVARGTNELQMRPYDSLTHNFNYAKSQGYYYAIIDLPKENVFTWYDAHPGFRWFKGIEDEVITNARDSNGARFVELLKTDGTEVTAEELAKFKQLNSQLSYGEQAGQPLLQGEKGATAFQQDGRAIIKAFQSADISTLAHESAHIWRRDLSPQDLRTVEQWAGVKNGNWTEAAEEKFARGFERYLAEGQAPTSALRELFLKFKEWLLQIYQHIVGSAIDVKLTDAITDIFDRLLAGREIEQAKGQFVSQGMRQATVGAVKSGEQASAREMAQFFQANGEARSVWFDRATGQWTPKGTGMVLGKQARLGRPTPNAVLKPGSEIAGWSNKVLQHFREILGESVLPADADISDLMAMVKEQRSMGGTLYQRGGAQTEKIAVTRTRETVRKVKDLISREMQNESAEQRTQIVEAITNLRAQAKRIGIVTPPTGELFDLPRFQSAVQRTEDAVNAKYGTGIARAKTVEPVNPEYQPPALTPKQEEAQAHFERMIAGEQTPPARATVGEIRTGYRGAAPHDPNIPTPDELLGNVPPIRYSQVVRAESDALMNEIKRVEDWVVSHWDDKPPTPPRVPPPPTGGGATAASQGYNARAIILKWLKEEDVLNKVGNARAMALKAGEANRNFVLHDPSGGKYNLDTIIARVVPFHFWVTREGISYLKLFMRNPQFAHGWSVMMEQLEEINQDVPENYRHMLGIDTPWGRKYLNIEAGFNPINRTAAYLGGLAGLSVEETRAGGTLPQQALAKSFQYLRPVPPVEGVLRQIGWLPPGLAEETGRVGTQTTQANVVQDFTAWIKQAHPEWGISNVIPPGGLNWEQIPANLIQSGMQAIGFKDFHLSAENAYDPTRIGREIINLASQGKITDAQAREALYAQRGPIWDQAFTSAYSTRASNDITYFLTSMRLSTILPSEKEIEAARLKAQKIFEQRDAGADVREQFDAFSKEFPWYFAYNSRYDAPEVRAGLEVKDIFYELSKLDQRVVKDALGDAFEKWVYAPTGTVAEFLGTAASKATQSQLATWLAKLSALAPAGILPDPATTPYAKATKAMSDAYDEWVARYKAVADVEAEYYNKPAGAARKTYLDAHPELKAYFDWNARFWASHQDLATLIKRPPSQPTTPAPFISTGSRGGGGGGGGSRRAFTPRQPFTSAPRGFNLSMLGSAYAALRSYWLNNSPLSSAAISFLMDLFRRYPMGARTFAQWLLIVRRMAGV